MDKCTICGADLESVCQEQSRQVLSDLPNESGGYDVEDQYDILCGWCPDTTYVEDDGGTFDGSV